MHGVFFNFIISPHVFGETAMNTKGYALGFEKDEFQI